MEKQWNNDVIKRNTKENKVKAKENTCIIMVNKRKEMNHNGTWSKKINGKQSKNQGIYDRK